MPLLRSDEWRIVCFWSLPQESLFLVRKGSLHLVAIRSAQARDTACGGEMPMLISALRYSPCKPLMFHAWLVGLLCTRSFSFSRWLLGLVFLSGFLLSLCEPMHVMTFRKYEWLCSQNALNCYLFAPPFYHFSFSTFTPTSLVHDVRNLCYWFTSATPRGIFNIIISHSQAGSCHKRPARKNCSQYLLLHFSVWSLRLLVIFSYI